ncbi:MAG: hypothetical protein ACWA5L_00910 [bacterium]
MRLLVLCASILLIGCNTVPADLQKGFSTEEQPAENALLDASIKQKTANTEGQWPDLYDIPTSRPAQLRVSEINRLEASLLKQRDQLSRAVKRDMVQAEHDRQIVYSMVANGRQIRGDLSKLASQLITLIEHDSMAAEQQTGRKIPKLGGRPPKNQR